MLSILICLFPLFYAVFSIPLSVVYLKEAMLAELWESRFSYFKLFCFAFLLNLSFLTFVYFCVFFTYGTPETATPRAFGTIFLVLSIFVWLFFVMLKFLRAVSFARKLFELPLLFLYGCFVSLFFASFNILKVCFVSGPFKDNAIPLKEYVAIVFEELNRIANEPPEFTKKEMRNEIESLFFKYIPLFVLGVVVAFPLVYFDFLVVFKMVVFALWGGIASVSKIISMVSSWVNYGSDFLFSLMRDKLWLISSASCFLTFFVLHFRKNMI